VFLQPGGAQVALGVVDKHPQGSFLSLVLITGALGCEYCNPRTITTPRREPASRVNHMPVCNHGAATWRRRDHQARGTAVKGGGEKWNVSRSWLTHSR